MISKLHTKLMQTPDFQLRVRHFVKNTLLLSDNLWPQMTHKAVKYTENTSEITSKHSYTVMSVKCFHQRTAVCVWGDRTDLCCLSRNGGPLERLVGFSGSGQQDLRWEQLWRLAAGVLCRRRGEKTTSQHLTHNNQSRALFTVHKHIFSWAIYHAILTKIKRIIPKYV